MTSTPASVRPLAGLRVLELGALIAGPFCAKVLAEFGAEVIKLEPPGHGDPLRKWRFVKDGTSVWWHVQSREKRAVTVDLRQPEGQAIARALAQRADIVFENFRPGTLEGWGLGYDSLAAVNPGKKMGRSKHDHPFLCRTRPNTRFAAMEPAPCGPPLTAATLDSKHAREAEASPTEISKR